MRNRMLALWMAPVLLALPAMGAANIVILNNDGPGVGLNDPTPAVPVGSNTGTTLGAQRLFALQHAINIWAAKLDSNVTTTVRASFTGLNCTESSAVLGAAGATSVFRNFAGAPFAGTWYPAALANKISGSDLNPAGPEIQATFNSNLGNTGCLTGFPFYLGTDANVPTGQIDFVAVALHELAHGLGFQTFTSGSTGDFLSSFPAVWDRFLFDTGTGLSWADSTPAQRAASAVSVNNLVWNGTNVNSVAGQVLSAVPNFKLTAPATIASNNTVVGIAQFGPPLNTTGLLGEIMPVVAQPASIGIACEPLNALNALAVNGKIALVDRGGCGFAIKVKNAQNAGAIGVVVANNTGVDILNMTGVDATITIPSVMISLPAGNALKTALLTRSRTRSGVFARLLLDPTTPVGTDASGRVRMFAPSSFQQGSSVSHFDSRAFPNLLMEPAINVGLTQNVDLPNDLTFRLFKDIGW
jgi:hypothetical protein